MTWFERLTGFDEASPHQVRENLRIKGDALTSLVNGKTYAHGCLEIPSLLELRNRVAALGPATGRLSVVNLATGAVEWTAANAFLPGAVSPALDVLRDRALAKQCSRGSGLLYVAVRNDSALTAVVVDSAGLDTTSPWPRFHHDNGNTGNPETPLTPWTCP